jgi:hypothetical protein
MTIAEDVRRHGDGITDLAFDWIPTFVDLRLDLLDTDSVVTGAFKGNGASRGKKFRLSHSTSSPAEVSERADPNRSQLNSLTRRRT